MSGSPKRQLTPRIFGYGLFVVIFVCVCVCVCVSNLLLSANTRELWAKTMNQNGAIDAISAPAHGSRRRSSMLAAQVLEAIRETDEEIFEETLHYDFVALGAGVAAGYWADVRVKNSSMCTAEYPIETCMACTWSVSMEGGWWLKIRHVYMCM